MPAITVKEAPVILLKLLKERAKQHRRSLQSEVLTILEEATRPTPKLDGWQVWKRIQELGVSTPSQSTAWVREARDRG